MNEELIQLLLKCKTLDIFQEEYLNYDISTPNDIYTDDGSKIDAELTLSAIMSHEINKNIISSIYWVLRPKYIRIEKIKRLLK